LQSSVSQPGFFNPDDVYIIAEGGVNHNGDVSLTIGMIDAAKATGANAIKFQTWITERVYSRHDSDLLPCFRTSAGKTGMGHSW